ncbi:hypothetical protein [Sphingopyxis sp. R3-92]|uniref:hypothetical protein n=1 Tax=Sphingopyxis sp. R3-92 TaxID=3158553 RepID=UPI003EE79638
MASGAGSEPIFTFAAACFLATCAAAGAHKANDETIAVPANPKNFNRTACIIIIPLIIVS